MAARMAAVGRVTVSLRGAMGFRGEDDKGAAWDNSRMPKTTVMFATYNEPQWLEWVLWGYATQTEKDFEVLVVDDGSRDDTRAVIDRVRPQLPYRLRHFWQPD